MATLRALGLASLGLIGLLHPLRDFRRQSRFRRINRKQIRAWEAGGRPVPPPDLIKYGVIRDNGCRHQARVLIETGTFYGNAIFTLRNDFNEIHSIELAPELYERNVRELRHLRHIHLHLGDSAELLPKVANSITEPVVFWLDGHFCAGPSARGQADTPVSSELEFLLRRPPGRNVVLIDDARLFVGENSYPTVSQLRDVVQRWRPHAKFEVELDIIRVAPV